MKNIISLLLDFPGYSIEQLTVKDAIALQTLYDRSQDFALMTYGKPFLPTAARDEFRDLPPGTTPEDIQVFGLFDPEQIVIGTIVAVKGYPNRETAWIGLMMIAPEYRHRGLGTKFYRVVEQWLVTQGSQQISLCVIKANQTGLKFWQKMDFTILRQTPPKAYGNKTHSVYVLNRTIGKN